MYSNILVTIYPYGLDKITIDTNEAENWKYRSIFIYIFACNLENTIPNILYGMYIQ